MARLTHHQREEQILRAALRVITRQGFGATSTRQVAREAGVQPGLLHHYFPSREGLLAAAFDLAAAEDLARLRAAVATGSAPLDRLRRFLRHYGPVANDPLVLLWVDAWSESSRDEQLRQTADRRNRGWVTLLTGIVAQGADDGSFTCERPGDAAWTILSLLDGLATQLALGSGLSARRARRLARRAVEDQLGLESGLLDARP